MICSFFCPILNFEAYFLYVINLILGLYFMISLGYVPNRNIDNFIVNSITVEFATDTGFCCKSFTTY